jgi:predicted acylesterase/phospholipase RssA
MVLLEYVQEKFEFFFETRQAFGRSALLLSGGATLGMYHLGVVKVLAENQLLPRVISGSSVGSIIASVVATRTDDELAKVFTLDDIHFDAFETKGSIQRKLWRLLSRGVLMVRALLISIFPFDFCVMCRFLLRSCLPFPGYQKA